ncbi:uncharacterized protein LOC125654609 isoform X2 [Ostrea edulis]|uniref:uncharacterized protein LOC125654609 isoform X2 n=1 Tax=Ostrea edulis TaxID=37623 RepID=UPI0024AEC97D|nr:uncharacterized protein LOC125654609 isoform X2 [Ostrea edulis]
MKNVLLNSIVLVYTLYSYTHAESNCIQRATDYYSSLTSTGHCLSGLSMNVSLDYINNCSHVCSMKSSSKKDNYARIDVKYETDVILKLESKKNTACGYSLTDIYIECTINQSTQEALQVCIINQCIDLHNTVVQEFAQENVISEDTNAYYILAGSIGGFLIGVVVSSLICLKSKLRCCLREENTSGGQKYPVRSLASHEATDGREVGAYQQSVKAPESIAESNIFPLYEDVSDNNTYNHLHEELKTVAIQTHYSTIQGSAILSKDSEALNGLQTKGTKGSEMDGDLIQQKSSTYSTPADSSKTDSVYSGVYFTLEKH